MVETIFRIVQHNFYVDDISAKWHFYLVRYGRNKQLRLNSRHIIFFHICNHFNFCN